MRIFGDEVSRYVSAVVATACAALAAAWFVSPTAGHEPLGLLLFALAFVVVQLLPIPIPHDDEVELVRFEEALVVPLALALHPFDAVLAVALGVGLGHVIQRAPLVRTVFNMAQMALSATACVAVVWLIAGPRPGAEPVAMAAALLGLLAMFVVNQLLFSGVMVRAGAGALRQVLFSDLQLRVMMWTANAAIGLMLVPALFTAPYVLVGCVVPLIVMHAAYRAHADRAREEQRLREMHQYATAMAGDLSLDRVAQCLVDSARRLVGADSAELRVQDNTDTWTSSANGVTPGPYDVDGARSRIAELAVPVQGASSFAGVLTVRCARPATGLPVPAIDDRDRTLLNMLVAQAETALDNAMLYRTVATQKRKLTQLFEHSNEGLLLLAPSGRVVSWNPAMARMSGFTADAVVDSPIGLISPQLGEIADQDGPSSTAGVMTTADGARRQVHASYSPIPGADDTAPELWVVVVRDVTRERETERMKDDFVATVSHELRTPLTSIKGFIDTLRRPEVTLAPDQVDAFLEIMSGQTERLERLISDLLDMSLIESGRQLTLDTVPTNLWIELNRAVEAFQSARPDADVVVHVPQVPLHARVDSHRLQQVLTNLLENAFKHARSDEPIEIDCQCDGSTVTLNVTDRGRGIADHDVDQIFERFYCTSDSVTRTGGGAGLGLYICRKLIEAMSGSIGVASSVGEGSTFSVTLPRVAAPAGDTPSDLSGRLLRAV